jgi:hypothetical protein
MSADTITVKFYGPFSWLGDDPTTDIFAADLGRKSGIYLWTVKQTDGELIYYVGETGRTFSVRMLEHFKEHMSGGYHLYKPVEFACGIKVPLWPGRYDRDRKTVAEFLQSYSVLHGPIEELVRLYRFFVAPLECEPRLRARIEAGLAIHLYGQEGVIGTFQDKGIRYRPRLNTEKPIQVFFEADVSLLGISGSLPV